jgi:hypothetical protein
MQHAPLSEAVQAVCFVIVLVHYARMAATALAIGLDIALWEPFAYDPRADPRGLVVSTLLSQVFIIAHNIFPFADVTIGSLIGLFSHTYFHFYTVTWHPTLRNQ